ncbi:MAG: DUF4011 domain-containing protein, partial [Pirellulaceae bacterium]|nr:DUF4011 domain-containing protein [Pirellulaceae bacterium]
MTVDDSPHTATDQNIDALIALAVTHGGLPTDDVLAAIVSLSQQAVAAHAVDLVAPLEGLNRLHVDSGRIFFTLADQQPIRRENQKIANCEKQNATTLDVVSHITDETDLLTATEQLRGIDNTKSLRVAQADHDVTRPVYLNGYLSWEHQLGHHDPLTDIFCIGQLLASLACGLDFRDIDDVQRFVLHRNNLFHLKADLHPVVAQVIFRMTELTRQKRVQDLNALVTTLQNYRDVAATVGFDPELIADTAASAQSKSELILRRLRERLFEITRRNRLLHFAPTMATINVTQASVPLSLDPAKIELDKLLIADDRFVERLGSGKSISLSSYINAQEVLYAPSVLDRIIADDRRERAEFGFGGLRLAMAFLNWANVKASPPEHYNSPLVLVNVSLKKKKGVKDKYLLEAVDGEAEVNPVLRHLMNQLYAIELPEKISLQAGAIADLAESLKNRIAESDNSIELEIVDRPQIDLIRSKAQKRLQLYKKRARVSGRGVRHFGDLQYSYDPANYHPLGIRIFDTRIRPPQSRLESMTRRQPPPRRHHITPDANDSPPEKTFYRWKEGGTGNPFHWQIDLCNITLASFKYRRMSLVRDYDSMIDSPIDNEAFEALFSSKPQAIARQIPQELSITDRFDVVACDPTQGSAIAEARSGSNYIVQGPPGTGKSQTITNLIADFVAQDKRVLFVCEKRAAIDVVFARLKAIGLGPVSCLIHDAQTDKKELIADLKATYESFSTGKSRLDRAEREKLQSELRSELSHLEQINTLMNDPLDRPGVSLAQLLDRCLELREHRPELSPLQAEKLPDYSQWIAGLPHVAAVGEKMRVIGPDGIVAEHPLAILRPDIIHQQQPLATARSKIAAAKRSLLAIKQRFDESGLSQQAWSSVEQVREIIEYADAVGPLASANLMVTLEVGNQVAPELNKRVRKLHRLHDVALQAAAKNKHWIEKLSPQDTQSALQLAQTLNGRLTNFVNPSWWRLRGTLRRCYNFNAHQVPPDWVRVLQQLQDEHDKTAVAERFAQELKQEYDMQEDPLQWPLRIHRVMRAFTGNDQLRQLVHRPIMDSSHPAESLRRIVETQPMLDSMCDSLSDISDSWSELDLPELLLRLDEIDASLQQLPRFLTVLESIDQMPERLSWAIRRLPLRPQELEAAIVDHTYRQELSRHPAAESFSGGTRAAHAARLSQLYDQWLASNSDQILANIGSRFRRHVADSEDPTPTSREERNLRRGYKKGRRELEHEFGKQMRYKPIRSLLSGDSRRVIVDLKPVWLMSPLSVSDTLPLTSEVDVVIFDEASQVTLEDAVPALCRGKQVIVVGDQMQLPPTNFFSTKRSDDDESGDIMVTDDDGEDISYDLSSA